MTRATPVPMALALLLASMLPEERLLVLGSLDDALAFAAGASSPAVADQVDADRPTVVPPRGES